MKNPMKIPLKNPMTQFLRPAAAALSLLALQTVAPSLAAASEDEIVVDATTPGYASDSILDGFPSLAPKDGNGDFGNNALAVALQDGVTEERAIVEFPLDDLAGLLGNDLASATLTFNIDDVLSTFGPGTAFDGTGPDAIHVSAYSGDGTVTVSDFAHGDDTTIASVDTDQSGPVTDASLAASGPVSFQVDVLDALADLLDAQGTHLGVALSIDDHKASASLDDLGINGVGPAGTGGARRPFLTVTLVVPDTTTTTTSTTSTTLLETACGDANDDGKVTSSDALAALRTAVGAGSCVPQVCDTDHNGSVTAADALRILRFAVGLPITLDCDAEASTDQPVA